MFAFEIREVSGLEDLSRLGCWRMHEYHLFGVNDIPNPTNTVLCKIMFDCCKTPPIKLPICQKNDDDKKKNKGVLEAVVTTTAQLTSISNVTDTKEEGVVDCCDGGLVSVDSYRPIGEEASSYEIDVEWANSLFFSGFVSGEEGENLDFECPIEDFTTNIGKRKLQFEPSMSKRLCC
ncbi:hypothetical protein POM88_035132 [Heracleum sosnowskyi]|uniref:Uncharacterized protein n=1 Tax=Heracleum sosnowskyi TaxID=360622 RepID=A0AAD8HMV9_9APIA|nr:hypothetical protein POM88_035132 [Heracleum sosnowskyi]